MKVGRDMRQFQEESKKESLSHVTSTTTAIMQPIESTEPKEALAKRKFSLAGVSKMIVVMNKLQTDGKKEEVIEAPKPKKSKAYLLECAASELSYTKFVAPNELLWLILGLPLEDTQNKCTTVKATIPETLIFGYSTSPICLSTDNTGHIVWRKITDIDIPSFHGDGIVALEKEAQFKSTPSQRNGYIELFKYKGQNTTPLSHNNLVESLTTYRKANSSLNRRIFRIQQAVKLKHRNHGQIVFTRVYYKRSGNTTVWSVTHSEADAPDPTPVEAPRPSSATPTNARRRSSLQLGTQPNANITFEHLMSKQQIRPATASATRPSLTKTASGIRTAAALDENARKAKMKDVWEAIEAEEEGPPKDIRRTKLRYFTSQNSAVREVLLSAATSVLSATDRIVKHLSQIFRHTLESMVLDFVKNCKGEYVLYEFGDFAFVNTKSDAPRPVELSSRLRIALEVHFECRVEGAMDDDDETPKVKVVEETVTEPVRKGIQRCKMCNIWLELRDNVYCLTSIMLYSTIIHLRSRLPPAQWPPCCADQSMTLRTMQRLEGATTTTNVTEPNLPVCELCYQLYLQEVKLMEVERQLAVFTRTSKKPLPKSEAPLSPLRSMRRSPTAKKTLKHSASISSQLLLQEEEASTVNSIRNIFRSKNSPQKSQASDGIYEPTQFLLKTSESHAQLPTVPSIFSQSTAATTRMKHRKRTPRMTKPCGRVVNRSELMENVTLCRLLIGLYKVADLPVVFLDAYDKFSLVYTLTGQSVSVPCHKSNTFRRRNVNRFKNPHVRRLASMQSRNFGNTSSSSSTESSEEPSEHSEEELSHHSDSASDSNTEESSAGSASVDENYIRSRLSQRIIQHAIRENPREDSENELSVEEEPEACVGALDIRFMRMSYILVPGDATGDHPPELNKFLQANNRVLIYLKARLKRDTQITSRHWVLPDPSTLSTVKLSKLKKRLKDIRDLASSQRADNVSGGKKSRTAVRIASDAKPQQYTPSKAPKYTEYGEELPGDAIAYGYLPLDQFRSNAVKRTDISIPMTYCISHFPKERSATLGLDRTSYPVDRWSLPYSLIHLEGDGVYIPEDEEQFSCVDPLPKEWLTAGAEKNNYNRRQGFETVNRLQVVGADIDATKRIAPVLHESHGRRERQTMMQQTETVQVDLIQDKEQRKERNENSIWCLSIQVVNAHYLSQNKDIFTENRPSWVCQYTAFGDVVNVSGEIDKDDYEDGVVVFDQSLTSKHMMRGSIDALEEMFEQLEPIKFSAKIVEVLPFRNVSMRNTAKALPAQRSSSELMKAAALSMTSNSSGALMSQAVKRVTLLKAFQKSTETKECVGELSLNGMNKERFVDGTIQLQWRGDTGAHNKMYPPYINVAVKLFRMGPPDDSQWLPAQTMIGPSLHRGVDKVIPNTTRHVAE